MLWRFELQPTMSHHDFCHQCLLWNLYRHSEPLNWRRIASTWCFVKYIKSQKIIFTSKRLRNCDKIRLQLEEIVRSHQTVCLWRFVWINVNYSESTIILKGHSFVTSIIVLCSCIYVHYLWMIPKNCSWQDVRSVHPTNRNFSIHP